MQARPNIVLIMTDQQRADFAAAEGFALDTTPFLDALGARGARFRHAYTPMPTCAPARCSLLTGRYPKATRVRENRGTGNLFAATDLVGVLREQGYATNLAGKNHTPYRAEIASAGTSQLRRPPGSSRGGARRAGRGGALDRPARA